MKTNYLLKSRWSIILALTLAFILSFNLEPSKVFAANSSASNAVTTKTINVMGNGEVTATPDIAYLFLGVVTDKTTTSEAQNANSITMNNVIAAIKKAGIKDEDIKTTDYSIYPKYNYDETTKVNTLVGYTVSNTLNVTVKDISKVGQIIDTAVANGANDCNSISFGVSDYEKYYNMALVNALSNAQGKAKAISNFLNIKLTAPITITENSSGTPNIYPISLKDTSSSSASTSIQAGIYKIKANVSLVFEY
jgi:uncharacterized protein